MNQAASTARGVILATANGGHSWTLQASATSEDLFDITCADPRTCYAVGDNSAITATANGGHTWCAQDATAHKELHAVACRGATCLAVGFSGTLVALTRGGRWAQQTNPASGTYAELRGVSCPRAGVCYAAGVTTGGDAIMATRDGGHTWSTQTSNTTERLYDSTCAAYPATACYAVGERGVIIMQASTRSVRPEA